MDLPDLQLLEAAPDAMVVVDTSGVIVLVNLQVEALFGYSREDLLGQAIEVLLPERYRANHPTLRQTFIDAPCVRTMGSGLNTHGKHRDGHEFPVEIRLGPIQSGSELFFVSTIRDATIHRQIEAGADHAIRKSEALLAEAQRMAQLGNWELDLTTGELIWSDEIYRIFNIDPQRFGASYEAFLEAIHPDDRESVDLAFKESVESKAPYDITHRLLMKDGTIKWVQERCETHYDGEGNPIRSIGTVLDITERKLAEDELKVAHDELEGRVRERTVALNAAKQEAEQANIAKSRFLAAASHDLRQPLQSIGLYLSVMDRLSDKPKLQEVSAKMHKSVDVMGELLDALLDVSKLDGGSITPEIKDFSTERMYHQLVADSGPLAAEKGLSFRCVGDPCVVRSDPALLQRIVENFVSNAIRYTESGGVEVRCDTSDNHARISVTDTGIGIPADALDTIFEEYFQLDNHVRDRRKGLGLGLSIVKHIARLLDHRLDVTSISGEGSTFSVEVPLGTPAEVLSAANEPPARPVQNARVPVVLFVDDDPAIVEGMTMMLEVSGIKVHTALDGDAALAHIAAGVAPDLVVSDYRLPKYNGVELIRRIRKQTMTDLPTVIMTGDTSSQEIEKANLDDCTILHKPVDVERLLLIIEQGSA